MARVPAKNFYWDRAGPGGPVASCPLVAYYSSWHPTTTMQEQGPSNCNEHHSPSVSPIRCTAGDALYKIGDGDSYQICTGHS